MEVPAYFGRFRIMSAKVKSKTSKTDQSDGSIGFIAILILLSIDRMLFHFLPNWLTNAPRYLVILFLILQPFRAYRITRIPELFVASSAIFFVFLRLPDLSSTNVSALPPESFNDSFTSILLNLVVISLIIPWNWLSYQMLSSKILRTLLLISSAIAYPAILYAQLNDRWAAQLYMFAMIFLLVWYLIASINLHPVYSSKRNHRGRILIILTPLSLLFFLGLFILSPTVLTCCLAHLGINLWLILVYHTVTVYPHAFFITSIQTARAANTFYDVKMANEKIDCMIYDNVDRYFRNIPEETVLKIDNDKLTLLWIGLQRND